MSKKYQPLPFHKQNYVTNVHVNPLTIVQKFAQLKKSIEQPEHTNKQAPVENKQSEIPRTKPIVKSKDPKTTPFRTKMCPHGRECRNRIRCKFAHTAQQLRRPFYKRTKPCLLYQRGLCSLGSACRQYHGNLELKNFDQKKYKTQLCQEFEKGSCPMGKICTKAHGDEQLNYYRAQAARMPESPSKGSEKNPNEKQKVVLKLIGYEGRKRDYKLQIVPEDQQHEQDLWHEEVLRSDEYLESDDNHEQQQNSKPPQQPDIQPEVLGDLSFSIIQHDNPNLNK